MFNTGTCTESAFRSYINPIVLRFCDKEFFVFFILDIWPKNTYVDANSFLSVFLLMRICEAPSLCSVRIEKIVSHNRCN
jgi:hypothetical protein